MRALLHIILCLCIGFPAAAQTQYAYFKHRVDNFRNTITGGNNVADTAILHRAVSLQDSISLARFADLEAEMLIITGKLNQQLGRMGSAEHAYKKAMRVGKSAKDSLWVAAMWDRLGNFYTLEERSYLALDCHLKALELREKYDKSRASIASSQHSIAKVYLQLGQLDVAENYLDKAGKLKQELKDTIGLGVIAMSQANLYREKGQFELAEKLCLQYIPKRLKQSNYEGLIISYLSLAQTYEKWGRGADAETYYLKALESAEFIKRQRDIGLILMKLGSFYQKNGQTAKAKALFSLAVERCTAVDSRIYQLNAYRNLYQMARAEGDQTKALSYLEVFTSLQDSSSRESLHMKLDDLEASFKLKQRETEIARLDEENKEGRQFRNILLAGIGLLLTLAIFLVMLFQSRNNTLTSLHREQQQTQQLLQEKEKLLEDLQLSNLHLIQAEKMASLGVMTAGIAHELNNPVSSISAGIAALKMDQEELAPLFDRLLLLQRNGMSDTAAAADLIDILKKTDLQLISTELQSLLKTILNGAQRTAEIVGGLKTFSRDTGDRYLPFKVEEGLETTLTLLHHKLNNDIEIKKSYRSQREILCQVSKLNQVFLNILDNAIQSLHGSGTIRIETYDTADACVVVIADTGIGMDADTQKKIFEPFFTTKEVGQGTGLGLSISYAIIQQHRGDITVSSSPGNGTEFKITLPLS